MGNENSLIFLALMAGILRNRFVSDFFPGNHHRKLRLVTDFATASLM